MVYIVCRREGTNIYDQDTYHGIFYHCSQHLLPPFQEDYISLPLVVWFEELPYGMSIVLCPIFHLVMQFLGLMKYEQNCHVPWVNRSFKNHCAFPVALLTFFLCHDNSTENAFSSLISRIGRPYAECSQSSPQVTWVRNKSNKILCFCCKKSWKFEDFCICRLSEVT